MALVGAGIAWLGNSRQQQLNVPDNLEVELLQATSNETVRWGCGVVDNNTDYYANHLVGKLQNVPNATACLEHCANNTRCMAWTYNENPDEESLRQTCELKELEEDQPPRKLRKAGAVSGALPCRMQGGQPMVSLFCFTLLTASPHEQQLLGLQHQEMVGVFACDSLALYSNVSFEVVPGIRTSSIGGGLESASGGEQGVSASLEVFMGVWKEVARSRLYADHDWTVKVDVATVFLPARLRAILPHHPEEAVVGAYLNNCKFNLRGSIEVLSRNAVTAWIEGTGGCFRRFAEVCSGPCGWGEDVFLDQCLEKVLGARRDNEWRLLAEEQCPLDLAPGKWTPDSCKSDHVAFHPFRTAKRFGQCLANARKHPSR